MRQDLGPVGTPQSDDLLSLAALSRAIHSAGLDGRARSGRPKHVSQLLRYIRKGKRVGGRVVRLTGTRLPDGWHASLNDWKQFLADLTSAARPGDSPSSGVNKGLVRRQAAVEDEIDRLRVQLRLGKMGSRQDGGRLSALTGDVDVAGGAA